jgi:hypothetical protein
MKQQIEKIRSFTRIYVGGADKFSAFAICSTTKSIFLGWVKEVGTTKS